MEEEITLFVHDNVDHIQKVVVRSSETVESLGKIANTQGKFLCFFNGSLLLGSFSFKFYNLTNGDHIYIIPFGPCLPGEKCPFICSIFENLFKCKKKEKEKPECKCRIDNFVRETAKLKDQFFQKVEGTVVCHRKILSRFIQLIDKDKNKSDDENKTVVPPPCLSPSGDALPTFWTESTVPQDVSPK